MALTITSDPRSADVDPPPRVHHAHRFLQPIHHRAVEPEHETQLASLGSAGTPSGPSASGSSSFTSRPAVSARWLTSPSRTLAHVANSSSATRSLGPNAIPRSNSRRMSDAALISSKKNAREQPVFPGRSALV
jgi:hypothetical protein